LFETLLLIFTNHLRAGGRALLDIPERMSDSRQALSIRAQKVRGIFNQFDSNKDGCLNRSEMAALVMAVNPRVKFTNEQIEAILDEVFRTYAEFILEGPKGLTFQGLLRTYDDGAGDVDRDFDALGLQLDSSSAVGNGTTPQEPYITVAAAAQTKVSRPGEEEGGCGGGSGSRLPSELSIADGEASSINGAIRSSNKLGAAWARSPKHGIA
jgi:hypothetical protein